METVPHTEGYDEGNGGHGDRQGHGEPPPLNPVMVAVLHIIIGGFYGWIGHEIGKLIVLWLG